MVRLFKSMLLLVIITTNNGFSRDVMAWVSACDMDDAKAMIQKSYGIKEAVSIIGLQWWQPDGDGGLVYSSDFGNDATPPDDKAVDFFKKLAEANNIKLYLCLYNYNDKQEMWDWNLAKTAFSDNPSRTADALADEVERLGLDGVDLDLETEGSASGDETDYADFVSLLSSKLSAAGKELSVCTYASDYGSPGMSWIGDWADEVDHVMCMAYEWAGVNGDITYSSLLSDAVSSGLSKSKFCIGMNADQGDSWQGESAQEHIGGVDDLNTGLCVWTAALKSGGEWLESETWDMVREISGKSVSVDTNTPSPNLVNLLDFYENADSKSSSSAEVKNGILKISMTQGGSVDKNFYASVVGECKNDFSNVEWFKITYKSNNPFTFQLYEEDLDTLGECYKEALPASSSYITKTIAVKTFFQPWWAEKIKTLNLSMVTGVTFDAELEKSGTTTISVKEIVAYGRSKWDQSPITALLSENPIGNSISTKNQSILFSNAVSETFYGTIFSLNGREIKHIFNGNLKSGIHNFNGALKDVPAGRYIVRFKSLATDISKEITVK